MEAGRRLAGGGKAGQGRAALTGFKVFKDFNDLRDFKDLKEKTSLPTLQRQAFAGARP